MIDVPGGPSIPEEEIDFAVSRAGGPGGQHVNTTATRVELRFDVAGSPSLDPAQRARILDRLRTRISREGILRVVASRERSQRANRDAAIARFVELLAGALAREAPRVPTRVSRSAKARRVDAKKREGAKKRLRASKGED
ncbi:MAG TPA: alternative ribosome rescue aminoacyl-tRNA hydrolase ArfB [Candidatus Polarisedimenticolaceae bacterium]